MNTEDEKKPKIPVAPTSQRVLGALTLRRRQREAAVVLTAMVAQMDADERASYELAIAEGLG